MWIYIVPGLGSLLAESGTTRMFFFCHLLSSHFLFFSVPPNDRRNSDPGSLSGSFFPPPHYGTRLDSYRVKNSALCSLVDSRRIALTHASKRSWQLVSLEDKNLHTEV